MYPAYVDYTSPQVIQAVRTHGLNKVASKVLSLQGIDMPEVTEKTAGEVVNACLTTHLLTKKYLDSSIDHLRRILR